MRSTSCSESAASVTRLRVAVGAIAAAAALALSPAQAAAVEASAKADEKASAQRSSSNDALEEAGEKFVPRRSEAATRVLDWVAASEDNGELPYMVIDKEAGVVHLLDPEGEELGVVPVLIGIATGDDSTPGVGSKKLSQLGPAEKTTPAGRFLAKYGWAAGRQKVLWIDYATSVAMHAVVTGNKKERRLERLASPDPEDNRITYGCINVPTEFYEETIRPLFEEQGGIVYVLPDTRPLEEVFPRVQVMPYL